MTFSTSTLANGGTLATVTVTASAPIPAGTAPLVELAASVPATAPYGATEALSLTLAAVNGVAESVPQAAGLQVVGYLGDADASGGYSSSDSSRILSVASGAASGFAAWPGIDPVVVGDTNGDGKLTAADTTLTGLPAIPSGITVTPVSATPFVSAPITLQAQPGGTVSVPITLNQALLLSSGQITVTYDPTQLDLTAVGTSPGSGVSVQATAMSAGSVTLALQPTGSGSVSGVLASLDFTVPPTVAPGSNLAVNLSAVSLNGQTIAESTPALDGTDGRINVILTAPAAATSAATAANAVQSARAALLGGLTA